MIIKVISGYDNSTKKNISANTLEELFLKGLIFIKSKI